MFSNKGKNKKNIEFLKIKLKKMKSLLVVEILPHSVMGSSGPLCIIGIRRESEREIREKGPREQG